jgi:hypothetical protein
LKLQKKNKKKKDTEKAKKEKQMLPRRIQNIRASLNLERNIMTKNNFRGYAYSIKLLSEKRLKIN